MPDGVELAVAGEVDQLNAGMLTDAFAAVLQGSEGTVFVDLGGVTYLDSSGLRVLLSQRLAFEAAGRLLVVTEASAILRRLFEVVGVTGLLLGSNSN
jgi:anti-anti-sigma factor